MISVDTVFPGSLLVLVCLIKMVGLLVAKTILSE